MKFWKRLRTIFSLLFVVLLMVGWLGIEPTGTRSPVGSSAATPTRTVPIVHP